MGTKKEDPIIDGLEVDDFGKPVYLHARNCPGYCDYACNTPQGDQVAEQLEKRVKSLFWSAVKPSESGWYWYADEKRKSQCVQVGGVRHNINGAKEDREVTFWNDFSDWISKLQGVWAGPIPEPSLEGDEVNKETGS